MAELMKFKILHHAMKARQTQTHELLERILGQYAQNTLFPCKPCSLQFAPDAVPNNLVWPVDSNKRSSTSRAIRAQSPGQGALAVEIATGRDYVVRAFCSSISNDSWHCEIVWRQGSKDLGTEIVELRPCFHEIPEQHELELVA
jgi:hypothetical protein